MKRFVLIARPTRWWRRQLARLPKQRGDKTLGPLPKLHDLIGLRTQIVKRPVITTVEVCVGPVRGRRKTDLVTGYVHKAYPRIYALLA